MAAAPPGGLPGPNGAGEMGRSNTRLGRAKTLTRPERHVAPTPLIAPTAVIPLRAAAAKGSWFKPWTVFSHICTFWAPPFILALCGIRDKPSRQAWREKVALCTIAILLGGFVGFATVGLNRVLCPNTGGSTPADFIAVGEGGGARQSRAS